MKQLFALLMMAIVAIASPAVLAGDKGKGEEKSSMKGENASEMTKKGMTAKGMTTRTRTTRSKLAVLNR